MSEFGKISISRFYVERFDWFCQYEYKNIICNGCKEAPFHPHLKTCINQPDLLRYIYDQLEHLPRSIIFQTVIVSNEHKYIKVYNRKQPTSRSNQVDHDAVSNY